MGMSAFDMDAGERYEAYAAWFYRCHCMMAPGKDEPMAMNSPHQYEDRSIRFDAFVQSLGPSDRAALLSTWLLQEARRD